MKVLNYKEHKEIREDVEPLYLSAFPEEERPTAPFFFASLEKK